MPHLTAMDYNFKNELAHTLRGTTNTYYLYDRNGQRAMKVSAKPGKIVEARYYIGNYEVYRKLTGLTLDLERTTLHIADDTGRIAILEERTEGTDDSAATLWRYIYGNHLQSACLELDENADFISYEEYHPFGTTAYQNNYSGNGVAKRYRYCGKERDEESGFYYYGARYYIPWLCRFTSVDPKALEYVFQSSYAYAENNPVKYVDVNGEGAGKDGKETETPSTEQSTKTLQVENTNGTEVSGKFVDGKLNELTVTATGAEWAKGINVGGLVEEAYYALLQHYENSGFQKMVGVNEEFKAGLYRRVFYEVTNQLKEEFISEKVGWKEWVPFLGTYLKGKEYDKMGEGGRANLQYSLAILDIALTAGDVKLIQNIIKEGAAKIAAKEVQKLLPEAFSRFSRFEYHFGKHAKEWGAITKDAYYKRALSLLESPVEGSVQGFTNSLGYTFRMNMKTGEFGIMRPDGVIESFYRRLKDPVKYWESQIAKWNK